MQNMKQMKKILIFALLVIFALPAISNADRRKYVWTYQYLTMSEGETELEFYQTTKLKPEGENDEWEYRFEVETGLTDRWDFSVYQIFKQVDGNSLSWDAVQLRTRYRFGEIDQYFMDPLLYFEYQRKLDFGEPNKFEAKLILAKSKGQLNYSLNPLYEAFFGPGTKHEIGLDAGISWEFSPRFVAGFESITRRVLEDDQETKSYFGPTISVASGHWWYTMGAAFGLGDNTDDARVRFLMGVGL